MYSHSEIWTDFLAESQFVEQCWWKKENRKNNEEATCFHSFYFNNSYDVQQISKRKVKERRERWKSNTRKNDGNDLQHDPLNYFNSILLYQFQSINCNRKENSEIVHLSGSLKSIVHVLCWFLPYCFVNLMCRFVHGISKIKSMNTKHYQVPWNLWDLKVLLTHPLNSATKEVSMCLWIERIVFEICIVLVIKFDDQNHRKKF